MRMDDAEFDAGFVGIVNDLERQAGSRILSMIDIRRALDNRNLDRHEQDSHLKRLSARGDLVAFPETRRAELTREAEQAAITIGGTANHLLEWQSR